MLQQRFSLVVIFYWLCAASGAIVPWYFNVKGMQQYGTVLILSHYFKDGTATPLSASITTDFFIGTTPVLIWMCTEAKRMKCKWSWILLPATFLISFAFSCSLFLAIRENRKLRHKGD